MAQKKIATFGIDFDGTLAEHGHGMKISDEVPDAISVCKELIEFGHKLILNTCRGGKDLLAAKDWCLSKGLKFYAYNNNPGQRSWTTSPKIFADIYIDDRCLGCPLIFPGKGRRPYVDWKVIRKVLVDNQLL